MPYDTDMQEMIFPSEAWRFIPQKPPFVFVTRLTRCEEGYAETEFDVPRDCVLVSGGFLYEGGIAEFMAQSCAVYVGCRDFLAGRKEPQTGVLGAVSRMKIDLLPPAGCRLSCRVEVMGDFYGMLMFNARVCMDCGNAVKTVAEGRLTTSRLYE